MSGCAGRLRRLFRRGKSLPPPGGTKSGVKKLQTTQQIDPKSLSASLPFIPTATNDSAAKKEEQPERTEYYEDDFNQDEQEEEEELESLKQTDSKSESVAVIYPAPSSFRSKSSDELEVDVEEDDEDEESNESSHLENNSIDKDKFITNLNKSLENELRLSNTGSVAAKQQQSLKQDNSNLYSIIKSAKSPSVKSKNKQTLLRFDKSFDTTSHVSLTKSSFQSNQFDHDISEASHSSSRNELIATTTIQKLFETYSVDKVQLEKLKSENEHLRLLINSKHKEAIIKESKLKQENDLMIDRVQDLFNKEARNESEKEALKKYFLSKQQETNESLIREQNKFIDSLQLKCQTFEKDLKKATENDVSQINFDELKDEINGLKHIVYHLNIELSSYQAKYPPLNLQPQDKSELSGLPKQNSIPIWLVNSKYLSPLIAAYDERISEKDEKLKLLKKKIDDLTNKFKMILDENNQLHSKLEKMPYTGSKSMDSDELNELNKIRHHARLVLEENQVLKEQLDLQQNTMLTIQKNQIQEVGTLSKRIIVNETDKTDLKNQIQILKANYDDLLRKYNDTLAETQRRVSLQEFLNQTGELKRKLDEMNDFHKQELEGISSLLKNLQEEKNELSIKYSNLNNENKKLLAENKVLDKALNDGIGRKTQRKIQELQKRLELSEIKEQTAVNILEKISQENEKLNLEKEAYQNLVKTNEIEIKKFENKLAEEDLKAFKLEDKLVGYKDKSASKLATVMQQLKTKDSEFSLFKAEYDKKLSDLLNLLQKKQDQIDDLVKEKRIMESEVEYVWQTTSNENRKLKESLLDLKIDKQSFKSHHKLLLDDY